MFFVLFGKFFFLARGCTFFSIGDSFSMDFVMVCSRVFVFFFASFFGNSCFLLQGVLCLLLQFFFCVFFCKEFCVFFQVFFSLDSVIYFCKWLCVFLPRGFVFLLAFGLVLFLLTLGFVLLFWVGVFVFARGCFFCCCFFKALFFIVFHSFSTIFPFSKRIF